LAWLAGAWSLNPGGWSLNPGGWSLNPGAWSLNPGLQGKMWYCEDANGNLLLSDYVLPGGEAINRTW
jgi:hypothetical protein